jgi:hypothetical protein
MNLQDLAQAYLDLRTKKEQLEYQLSEVNKEFDKLRLQDIPTLMEEQGIRNATFEGIGRVGLTADLYVTCPADKKPELYNWLREHGFEGLIVDYVHPSTLKAWIKERLLASDVQLPEIVNVTPFMRASVTKVS